MKSIGIGVTNGFMAERFMPGLFDELTDARLPIDDAHIELFEEFDCGDDANKVMATLVDKVDWREEKITLFGKSYLQPRLFAWYGDERANYQYSGITLSPLAWIDELNHIKQRVSAHCGAQFNSVLLNYYRDHRDSMGMHADDERELGREPIIASLSFGATRVLKLKHKSRKDLKPLRIPLHSSTLMVMRGKTQQHWKHGIDKLSTPCGPRLNLTFRQIF
ncbi:MAG: alpha-ketoglutarate-dependent dioxygenase AlkB [Pseudomonadales bacterium]